MPFELGQVVFTQGARELAAELQPLLPPEAVLRPYLSRYQDADWGETPAPDKANNDQALHHREKGLMAIYATGAGNLWIITDYGRATTTLLVPEEY